MGFQDEFDKFAAAVGNLRKAGRASLGVTLAIVAYLFFLGGQKIPATFGSEVAYLSSAILIFAAALLIGAHLISSYRAKPVRGSAAPRVIGWAGIETDELYKKSLLPAPGRPECLVCLNSMDTLPQFTFRGEKFDFVACDIEFLDRYHTMGRLQNLKMLPFDVEEKILTEVPGFFLNLIRDRIYDLSGCLRGIPMQFGFTEVLVNRDNLPSDLDSDNYASFSIENLLSYQSLKIGFWHWYLPSITHLLLPESLRKAGSLAEAMWGIATTPLSRVEEVISQLMRNGERIRHYDTAFGLTDGLLNEGVGVVFGAGSSLITSNLKGSKSIECLVPERRLPIWVNCCGLLAPQHLAPEHAAAWLAFWLHDGVQEALSEYEGYRGCSVKTGVLEKLRFSRTEHHIWKTLESVLDSDCVPRNGWDIAVRHLPDESCSWQRLWYKLWRQVNQSAARVA